MIIKTLKLITGEEIISYVDISSTKYILNQPLNFVMNFNGPQGDVSFAPWLISGTSENIDIDVSKVVCCITPSEEAINAYKAVAVQPKEEVKVAKKAIGSHRSVAAITSK